MNQLKLIMMLLVMAASYKLRIVNVGYLTYMFPILHTTFLRHVTSGSGVDWLDTRIVDTNYRHVASYGLRHALSQCRFISDGFLLYGTVCTC